MNILRITRTFIPVKNGTSIHIHELSNEQFLRGNNIRVITPFICKENKLNYKLKIISLFSKKIFGPPGTEHALFNSKLVWILYSLFTSLEIIFSKEELIHFHGDIQDIFGLPILKILLPKKKFFRTIHGNLNQSKIYKLICNFWFQNLDGIVVVNKEIKNIIMSSLNYKKLPKIIVQSSGVRKKMFLERDIFRKSPKRL